MNSFAKRILLLSGIILIIFSLTSCGLSAKKKVSERGKIFRDAEVIVEGIKKGDYESIAELFSLYVKQNYPNLQHDIAGLMEYIDGDIVSYERISCASTGGYSEYGEWIEHSLEGEIYNIKTSNDKTYVITFGGDYVNKNKPDLVGAQYIVIFKDRAYSSSESKCIYYEYKEEQ